VLIKRDVDIWRCRDEYVITGY